MVAFLGTFGARRSPSTIDAAAHVIECGLLGREAASLAAT
jgi:hypothetical protein